MPKPGKVNVSPVAIRRLSDLIIQRTKQGMLTYKSPLQTFNGRDALQDCLEELVDATLYLMQAIMEREAEEENDNLQNG
ncbi:hypothetical protein LCGC14_1485770 [marine sediment metagenome]|uniref:Uncharacterized protein n=1 Tax=marine sediment metagenome TaxID=412755 RepID=A0A0F9LNT2_9ZZZZ